MKHETNKCKGCGKRIRWWNRSSANGAFHGRCIRTWKKAYEAAIAWTGKQNKAEGYPTPMELYFTRRTRECNLAKAEEITQWCDTRINIEKFAKSIQRANEISANVNHVLRREILTCLVCDTQLIDTRVSCLCFYECPNCEQLYTMVDDESGKGPKLHPITRM